jgi:hypothetical protein
VREEVPLDRDNTLVVALEGYRPWRRGFRLSPDRPQASFTARLVRLGAAGPRQGTLWVGSGKVDARVYLEGSLRGSTPLELKQVTCGKRLELVIRAEGYEDHALTLEPFSPGERRKVEVSLRPLASGLKHGVRAPSAGPGAAADHRPVEIPRARPVGGKLGERRKVGETLPPR